MSAPQCPFNGGDHRLQVDPDKPCPVCGDYGDYRAWEDDNCVEPREPLTSHAVAAAEIARLRAEVAALREALQEIVRHCNNQGYGNPIADNRTVDRCEETAMAALAAQEQAP